MSDDGGTGSTAAAFASLLFVPGSRPDRFAKALAARRAGMVCIDLEDAVPADGKDAARMAALADQAMIAIRINGVRDARRVGGSAGAGGICPRCRR